MRNILQQKIIENSIYDMVLSGMKMKEDKSCNNCSVLMRESISFRQKMGNEAKSGWDWSEYSCSM